MAECVFARGDLEPGLLSSRSRTATLVRTRGRPMSDDDISLTTWAPQLRDHPAPVKRTRLLNFSIMAAIMALKMQPCLFPYPERAALTHRRRRTSRPGWRAACLVGQIVLDASSRKDDDPDWQGCEHLIVALERRSIAVTCPIRLEDDLGNLAVVGPTGGDALGAARAPAVQQNHVAVFGTHLVERGPDAPVIVARGAPREGDARAGGNVQFGLGATLCGDEFAAVDHGGRQRAMVDNGA